MVVHSIGLSNGPRGSFQKRVKLMNSAYLMKLLDLHRSNQFGPYMHTNISELYRFSEGWRSRDAVDSILHYSRLRDLHGAGVIMLQMGLGLTVIDEFQTPRSALEQVMRACPSLKPSTFCLDDSSQATSHARPPRQCSLLHEEVCHLRVRAEGNYQLR